LDDVDAIVESGATVGIVRKPRLYPIRYVVGTSNYCVDVFQTFVNHVSVELVQPIAIHLEHYLGFWVEQPDDWGKLRKVVDVDYIASARPQMVCNAQGVEWIIKD